MKNEAIEMINMPLSMFRVAVCCLPLALVASCGSDSGAPTGSTITVSPSKVEWAVTLASCDNTTMQDTYFNIAVNSPTGTPVNGINLKVNLELSPGTFIIPAPFVPVMYLYDDLDGDGLYTDPITVFPYYTKTGSFGTKLLRIQYDLGGCTYAGNLDVFSGAAFGSSNIAVKEAT